MLQYLMLDRGNGLRSDSSTRDAVGDDLHVRQDQIGVESLQVDLGIAAAEGVD